MGVNIPTVLERVEKFKNWDNTDVLTPETVMQLVGMSLINVMQ